MGQLDLLRLMHIQRHRDLQQCRRQDAPNEERSIVSRPKRNCAPCQRDDSQGGEIDIYSGPSLPEDVWCHIHSLMPMQDAARAACVSHAFYVPGDVIPASLSVIKHWYRIRVHMEIMK